MCTEDFSWGGKLTVGAVLWRGSAEVFALGSSLLLGHPPFVWQSELSELKRGCLRVRKGGGGEREERREDGEGEGEGEGGGRGGGGGGGVGEKKAGGRRGCRRAGDKTERR